MVATSDHKWKTSAPVFYAMTVAVTALMVSLCIMIMCDMHRVIGADAGGVVIDALVRGGMLVAILGGTMLVIGSLKEMRDLTISIDDAGMYFRCAKRHLTIRWCEVTTILFVFEPAREYRHLMCVYHDKRVESLKMDFVSDSMMKDIAQTAADVSPCEVLCVRDRSELDALIADHFTRWPSAKSTWLRFVRMRDVAAESDREEQET